MEGSDVEYRSLQRLLQTYKFLTRAPPVPVNGLRTTSDVSRYALGNGHSPTLAHTGVYDVLCACMRVVLTSHRSTNTGTLYLTAAAGWRDACARIAIALRECELIAGQQRGC
jgi:hypothetical protein